MKDALEQFFVFATTVGKYGRTGVEGPRKNLVSQEIEMIIFLDVVTFVGGRVISKGIEIKPGNKWNPGGNKGIGRA